jgi:integrase
VSRKRGNGEGTIHRRKDGGWCAQYTVYTAEGRKRKTIYGKTRAEVGREASKGAFGPSWRPRLRRRGPDAR